LLGGVLGVGHTHASVYAESFQIEGIATSNQNGLYS